MTLTEGIVANVVIISMILIFDHYMWEEEYAMGVITWVLFMATLLTIVLA